MKKFRKGGVQILKFIKKDNFWNIHLETEQKTCIL